jgi:hypothetical protein
VQRAEYWLQRGHAYAEDRHSLSAEDARPPSFNGAPCAAEQRRALACYRAAFRAAIVHPVRTPLDYIRYAYPLARALPPGSAQMRTLFEAIDCAFEQLSAPDRDSVDRRMQRAGALLAAGLAAVRGGRLQDALHKYLRIYAVSPRGSFSSQAVFWQWAERVGLARHHVTCLARLGRPEAESVAVLRSHAEKLARVRAPPSF